MGSAALPQAHGRGVRSASSYSKSAREHIPQAHGRGVRSASALPLPVAGGWGRGGEKGSAEGAGGGETKRGHEKGSAEGAGGGETKRGHAYDNAVHSAETREGFRV